MFPTYEEYRRFLERQPTRQFHQGCYYQCAMAILGQGPVGEGFTSDIDMDAPDWFAEHERRANKRGMWVGTTSGSDILKLLLELDPDGCYPFVTPDSSVNLRRNRTVDFAGWRVRFDVEEPSPQFLANFLRDCSGPLFEAVFDAVRIGLAPFSLRGGPKGVRLAGEKTLCHLGGEVHARFLAGPDTVKKRHLRAYRIAK